MHSIGYDAEPFASAETFPASSNPAIFDCVNADADVLGMNGRDLVRKLRELGHTTPVTLMTAVAGERLDDRAISLGAPCLLKTPLTLRPWLIGSSRSQMNALNNKARELAATASFSMATAVERRFDRERAPSRALVAGLCDADASDPAAVCLPAPARAHALDRAPRGLHLFTLTDNTAAISRRQLTHGGIIDLFDRRFSVDDTAKRHKPVPEAYAEVTQALGASPSEMCMIDATPGPPSVPNRSDGKLG
jgi:FixJ family two-component response regulator